jgi:hypothetical protein
MKYVMVTNWNDHWDNLGKWANRTLFTESMLKGMMSKDKLVEGTETLFIKRKKETGIVEQCWSGKISDFKYGEYKGFPAVWFRVNLEKRIVCPDEYRNYPLGWHYENLSKVVTQTKSIMQKEYRDTKYDWEDIEKDFEISKNQFGRRISFVKNSFRRYILFRDVEQAYALSKLGFYKPAVILSGGIIEELLRLFLENKGENVKNKKFEELIQICQKNQFLRSEINNLASAIRRFRNYVHLATEKSKKNSISKATASATVALIFTIINDF